MRGFINKLTAIEPISDDFRVVDRKVMDSSQWKIIKETFSAVVDLSLPERSQFLKNSDENVRREVEKLISAHEKSDKFIEKPFLLEINQAKEDFDENFVGKHIDDYVILEKIGAGGMGAVFLAEHRGEDFTQKVALKIIKRGMDTNAVLKRFLMERQILAQLEHQNIARLIDGGSTTDGTPYFVMEYVEGENIKEFCENHQFDIRERLEIFTKICAAISYAHQKLVVHRDIKPSNIIVTETGEPKLLDFGIAKLLSPDWNASTAEATATQMRVMTPEYASPEQIRGHITTTSTDVYSLGVVLYELLTGTRPFQFKDKSPLEIAEKVVTQEPLRPSAAISNFRFQIPNHEDKKQTFPNDERRTTNDERRTNPKSRIPNPKFLRGDLDNIVLKALRKEPERRYQSVQEFSEDIRRHLNGLPVSATADSSVYRFSKFVQRHRTGVFLSSFFMALILAVSGVAVWQAISARRAQNRAEMRFNQVREIANTVLFDYYDKIENLPNTIELRQKIVSDALKYLDNLAAENTDDISLKRELAKAYDKISEVQFGLSNGNLGDSAGALANAEKALQIAEEIAEDKNATPEDTLFLADMYVSLAGAKGETGDLVADVSLKKKAIEIYEKIYNENPNDIIAETNLAKGYFFIAIPMKFVGDTNGAIENLQKSAEIYQKLVNQVPNEPKYIRNVSLSYKYVAPLYLRAGNSKEAIIFSQKATEIDEKRLSFAPDDLQIKYDLSRSYEILAESFLENGNVEKAEETAVKALNLVKEVSEANPKNSYYRDSYGLSLKVLSNARQKQNQSNEAIKLTKEAVEIWKATVEKDATDVFTKVSLAKGYSQIGENYLLLAETSNAKENTLTAENWFRQSEKIWQDLQKNQTIFEYYKSDFEKVGSGLEKCRKFLG